MSEDIKYPIVERAVAVLVLFALSLLTAYFIKQAINATGWRQLVYIALSVYECGLVNHKIAHLFDQIN